MQFIKLFFSLLLIVGLLAPAAFAATEPDPHELLSKSFRQADLWNQGPVKLVAKIRMPNAGGQALNFEYTVFWAGPEKWRAEWSASGRQRITILNHGKLSYVNKPKLPWSAVEFEAALAALDGATPAGPYPLAPLDYENAKFHVSKKTIDGTDARCLAFGETPTSFFAKGYREDLEGLPRGTTTFCIDPASGHLLTAASDLGNFEYTDYTSIGSNSYPQTVKLSWGDTPIGDAQVTVTRGEKFPDSLFIAPEKNTTVDFPSCADLATNFTPPRLDKSAKPKMPAAARKAHQYGVVWVLATVGKDGAVQKTKVLGNKLPELNTAATSAVQRYKYTPYIRCGQAVEFQQLVVVPFAPPPPPVPIEQPFPPARHP
ncbi:MAG: energy transducer TonB [Candidatus Korobacteraceae bacterium]